MCHRYLDKRRRSSDTDVLLYAMIRKDGKYGFTFIFVTLNPVKLCLLTFYVKSLRTSVQYSLFVNFDWFLCLY